MLLRAFDAQDDGEPGFGGAATYWSPELLRRAPKAAAGDELRRHGRTRGKERNGDVPEKRQLTRSTVVPTARSKRGSAGSNRVRRRRPLPERKEMMQAMGGF